MTASDHGSVEATLLSLKPISSEPDRVQRRQGAAAADEASAPAGTILVEGIDPAGMPRYPKISEFRHDFPSPGSPEYRCRR
jgi:hypothetical protein